MATEIWVNIGSGNGLLPDGTKSLPEPMLIYHQSIGIHLSTILQEIHQSLKLAAKLLSENFFEISQGPMS